MPHPKPDLHGSVTGETTVITYANKETGMVARADAKHVGGEVYIIVNDATREIEVHFVLTGGRDKPHQRRTISRHHTFS